MNIFVKAGAIAVQSYYGEHLNALQVQIGELILWFSYSTCIAFCTPKTGKVVSQNDWGPTTGKHFGEIDGNTKEARKKRLPYSDFR